MELGCVYMIWTLFDDETIFFCCVLINYNQNLFLGDRKFVRCLFSLYTWNMKSVHSINLLKHFIDHSKNASGTPKLPSDCRLWTIEFYSTCCFDLWWSETRNLNISLTVIWLIFIAKKTDNNRNSSAITSSGFLYLTLNDL